MRKPTLRLAAMALALFTSWAARADNFVFVRNARNSTARLSRADVRAIYTGKQKQWGDGKLVQVVLGQEGSPGLGWLTGTIFGVGEVALITKIKQEVFKGEMRRPISCEGDEDCIAKVKANEGGVAVVSSEAALALPSGVVVLPVSN